MQLRNAMKQTFRRADTVTIHCGEKSYKRRGTVLPVRRDSKFFTSQDLLYCGSLETPLYRYLGDAAELLENGDATLSTAEESYRVLHAEAVAGIYGCMHIQAILERQVKKVDGQ